MSLSPGPHNPNLMAAMHTVQYLSFFFMKATERSMLQLSALSVDDGDGIG